MRRYPLQPLLDAAGITMSRLREVVALGGSTYANARRIGLTVQQADRYAVKLGLHPYLVWPEMADHALEDAEAAEVRQREYMRRYAARRRQDPAYRERQAAYMSEYRSSERAREAARAYRRSYYAANRERELARQAAYDARRRGEVA